MPLPPLNGVRCVSESEPAPEIKVLVKRIDANVAGDGPEHDAGRNAHISTPLERSAVAMPTATQHGISTKGNRKVATILNIWDSRRDINCVTACSDALAR